MRNRTSYIIARIAGLLLVAVFACIYAVQTPKIQTAISSRVLEKLNSGFNGAISCGEIRLLPSGALLIRDFAIIDRDPVYRDSNSTSTADTILRARLLTGTFSIAGIFDGEGIHLGRLRVDDAYFHLVVEPNEFKSNISRVFNEVPKQFPPVYDGRLFDLRKFDGNRLHYRLTNLVEPGPSLPDYAIDYNDLDVRANVSGRRISYSKGVLKARLSNMSLVEKSGYTASGISADVKTSPGKVEVRNAEIRDLWSDVRISRFNMNFNNVFDFEHFEDGVLMEMELKPSRLSLKSLSYFAGIAPEASNVIELKGGKASGYIGDLNIEKLTFALPSSGISGNFSGSLGGLPDVEKLLVNAELEDFRFSTEGVENFVAELIPGKEFSLGPLDRKLHFISNISATGPVNRLKVSARLSSRAGNAGIRAEIRNLFDPARPLLASSTLYTDRLDLGRLTDNEQFGELSADASVRIALHPDSPEFMLDSLNISSFDALGYRYSSIRLGGSMIGDRVRLTVDSNDPNFKIDAAALADIGDGESERNYMLKARLDAVDLHSIGLDQRSVSLLSAGIDAEFTRRGYYVNGKAVIDSLCFENATGRRNIGDIHVNAYNFAAEQHVKVSAPFAEMVISAGGSPADMLADLLYLSVERELTALCDSPRQPRETGNFRLDLSVHNAQDLLGFVLPGAYIADGTSLNLEILDNGEVMAIVNSGRIAYGTNFFRDLDLRADNMGGSLNLAMKGSKLRLGSFEINSPKLGATAHDNSMKLDIDFDSFGSIGNDGHIGLTGSLRRDSTDMVALSSRLSGSYINSDKGQWIFNDAGFFYNGRDFDVDGFRLGNGEQYISVSGSVCTTRPGTMGMRLHELDLSIASGFGGILGKIEGTARGSATLHTGPDRSPGLLMDLNLDSLRLGGVDAGSIYLASIYEDNADNIELYLRNEVKGNDVLFAKGTFFPRESRLDLDASLDRMPVNIASALIGEHLSKVDGSISGDFNLRSENGRLNLMGDALRLNSVGITPAYTGVHYTVEGPFRFDGGSLRFDSLSVSDDDEGSGTLSGELSFRDLRNIGLSANLGINRLKVLDQLESEHGVYGMLRANGNIALSGPLNALEINAELNTSGPGNIHIPTFTSATGSTSDLLTFTAPAVVKDDYEAMLEQMETTREAPADVRIRARIGIQSGVRAYILMDKSNGNMATISPQGNLVLNLRPSDDLIDISGDLSVNDGNYRFAIPGIITKDFVIEPGSAIRFAGNLPDTQLDINATYSLKASLETLIPNSSESLKRTVNCGINISDRLRNPRLAFSIDVPDLNPTARSQIESALSTDDKVQKQFVALLVLGSFMPDESSGVIDSNDILLSNVTSFMATQVNSILQRLDVPLDIGLDYHESATTGSNIFDVAISTQLFNNRVIVGGSVANRNYTNNTSAQTDVIGDLDIQIKLDPEGRYRFNMFSHSADEYTSILDASQRNGVGLSFQKEYNSFGDLLRSIVKPKKTQSDTSAASVRKEMKTIKIEADNSNE